MIFKWNIIESISQQHKIWSATAAIYPQLHNSSYNDLVLSSKWRWIVQFIFLSNYSVSDRMSSHDNHLISSSMTSDYHSLGMENWNVILKTLVTSLASCSTIDTFSYHKLQKVCHGALTSKLHIIRNLQRNRKRFVYYLNSLQIMTS